MALITIIASTNANLKVSIIPKVTEKILPDEIKSIVMPRLSELRKPVIRRITIAIQLTRLNLLAMAESISVRAVGGSSFLREGTSTSEMKNIPPSQIMAANRCSSRMIKAVRFKSAFLKQAPLQASLKVLEAQIIMKKTIKGNQPLEFFSSGKATPAS